MERDRRVTACVMCNHPRWAHRLDKFGFCEVQGCKCGRYVAQENLDKRKIDDVEPGKDTES